MAENENYIEEIGDLNINERSSDFEESLNSFEPQRMDNDTFKQRNDPQELILRFKLQLMNAYVVNEQDYDETTGLTSTNQRMVRKKGTKPTANKDGVEDIIGYLENLCNNHIVQANITNIQEFNKKMLSISDDVTLHFMSNRKRWGVNIKQIDIIISKTINLFDLFLTRTLFNEERKGYGESYKENTHREIKPENKQNVFERVANRMFKR